MEDTLERIFGKEKNDQRFAQVMSWKPNLLCSAVQRGWLPLSNFFVQTCRGSEEEFHLRQCRRRGCATTAVAKP